MFAYETVCFGLKNDSRLKRWRVTTITAPNILLCASFLGESFCSNFTQVLNYRVRQEEGSTASWLRLHMSIFSCSNAIAIYWISAFLFAWSMGSGFGFVFPFNVWFVSKSAWTGGRWSGSAQHAGDRLLDNKWFSVEGNKLLDNVLWLHPAGLRTRDPSLINRTHARACTVSWNRFQFAKRESGMRGTRHIEGTRKSWSHYGNESCVDQRLRSQACFPPITNFSCHFSSHQ